MLSDVQGFTKLFYPSYTRSTRSKWRETYHAFRRAKVGSVANPEDIDREVGRSILKAFQDGQLDLTVPEDFGAEDDNVEEEGGNDQDDEDPETSSDEVHLPKVPLWYMNAVMAEVWKEASQSQQDAVREYKKTSRMAVDGMEVDENEDMENKVTRLERVLKFVTSQLTVMAHTHFLDIVSNRSGVESTVVQLLDQIFNQAGLVGSVTLSGPDPQNGGKLIVMSCVLSLL
jgi:hypothetical protein